MSDTTKSKPDNFVIVIGRQFGSGGRTIGKLIAGKLGIEYYDTELIKKAAEAEGVSPSILEDHDEKKPSVLKALLQGAYGIADNFHTIPLSGENFYTIQCRIIKDLCKKSSCVIVGRNADFILRHNPNMVSVFLHSPLEHRAKRIVARNEAESLEQAVELANRHDRRRESYYNFYRGEKKWGVADNYHLCFDTSRLDNDTIADIVIKSVYSNMQKRGLSLGDNREESPGNNGRHAF